MTTFSKAVKEFKRELRELKSAPTRSPSEMVLKQRTITIYPVIVGYKSRGKLYTLPSKAGVATIALDQPGFATVEIISARESRQCMQRFASDASGNRQFILWVQDGSPADASELGGSMSNNKTIGIQIRVTATCDFTLTQSQTEDWI